MTPPSADGGAAGRGRYGVDAPNVLLGLALGAVGAVVATAAAAAAGWWLAWVLVPGAVYAVASAASFAYTTRRGKFAVWAAELERLGLGGSERALELGCGRGAVLVMVAKLLPRGMATGIDLWRSQDQSANAAEATRRNADAEGVADRVGLVTGDIRRLPFGDACFDLVVSSLTVHNVSDRQGRDRAISEAYRVLAPGGRLLVTDFRHAEDYAVVLRRLGADEVAVRDLGWRFWYGGPWFGTRLVTANRGESEALA
jgi:SAM-dependent methyltransferase